MNFETDLYESLKALQSGGIILYPTDTIWGIGCDATNANAVQKIYRLKNREEKKSLIILVTGEDMIRRYVKNPSEKMLNFATTSQQPTTAIFSDAIHLPTQLVNEDGTIAIRIVNELFCRNLIQQLKKPLVSTSANISGERYPENFSQVSEKIKTGVDYIVQHRQNDLSKSAPSRIIKLNNENEIAFLR